MSNKLDKETETVRDQEGSPGGGCDRSRTDCGKGPCHDTVVRVELTKWELRVEEGERSPDVATLAGGQVSKCHT